MIRLAVGAVVGALALIGGTQLMAGPLDGHADPSSVLARAARGGMASQGRNIHERQVRELHRHGRVGGMVFRTKYAEALDEITVAGGSGSDPGSPSVTVDVPEGGGIIEVYAEVELKNSLVGSGYTASVALAGGDIGATGFFVITRAIDSYQKTATASGDSAGANWGLGGPLRFYVPTAGEQTFRLKYTGVGAGNTSYFKNRRLWVGVARAGS